MNFFSKSLILSAVLLPFVSNAEFFIQWENQLGGLTTDGNTANPLTPNPGDQALLQLWFAGADGLIDPEYREDGATFLAGGALGDDQLLSSVLYTNDGVTDGSIPPAYVEFSEIYGAGGTQPYLSPGSVFIRVLQSTSVTAGASYLTSPVQQVDDKDFSDINNPPAPNTVNFPSGVYQLTSTVSVIPEPSTFALMIMTMSLVLTYRFRSRLRK